MSKKVKTSFDKFIFQRFGEGHYFIITGDHYPVDFNISIQDLSEQDIENLAKFFNDWVSEIQTKKVFK